MGEILIGNHLLVDAVIRIATKGFRARIQESVR
ncbi:hypothetical protein SS1G_06479 [Sclerotinia sclerotiorum 1980 UF-70]|uniref:Uncharacterized protein n=1 Tax=Sclerotinia sclerotiorum (strain ATCC 18683 / 1980 / Ss-1) TaxID=665079 RepID=A7EMD1_SCLS1|nr:hypothetical protein SS1G_06479 [Sclerotinia sclerotiorum 1980 UF-70]EDO03997.1 hypothetical protein SS1G_06479 [Sclerotinia sclerotiorum 1980 UF-70]